MIVKIYWKMEWLGNVCIWLFELNNKEELQKILDKKFKNRKVTYEFIN